MTLTEIVKLSEELRGEGLDPSMLMEIAMTLGELDKRLTALETARKADVK